MTLRKSSNNFHDDLKTLLMSPINEIVKNRVREFHEVRDSSEERWFSELCFCLLTANAKQKTAAAVQQELGFEGFMHAPLPTLVKTLQKNKHRFHNNKSKYIEAARVHFPIKQNVLEKKGKRSDKLVRNWLAETVRGMGLKEASHFLRNVGLLDVSIIDRHILRVMYRYRLLRVIPKSITKKKYLSIEEKLRKIAKQYDMSMGELDLYMWYMNTGEILK